MIFIDNKGTSEQYCLVVDNKVFYRFNGKIALYSSYVAQEKVEYAKRMGGEVEIKRAYGLYKGVCRDCGCPVEDTPVMKQGNGFVTICPECGDTIIPQTFIPIENVAHQMSKRDYVGVLQYEEDELGD